MGTTRRGRAVLSAAALTLALAATGCSVASTEGSLTRTVVADPDLAAQAAPDAASADPSPVRPRSATRADGLTDPAAVPHSTFPLDVDTASYPRFRDAVRNGTQLPRSEIRTEAFVNYFEQDYPAPQTGLDVSLDATVLPFRADHRLVRVGIRSADAATRADTDLAVVVDCSGSMGEDGRMETTKAALRTLVAALRPSDRVAMVCYSTGADVVLEPTAVADRAAIDAAIGALTPQASTNAAAGLDLGYDLAAAMRSEGRTARVVLVTDGVAGIDGTTPGGTLERIGVEAGHGTTLVAVGVGTGVADDAVLAQLADRGDGRHVHVETVREAERLLAPELTGSLVVAATDAAAQVTFDPRQVSGYRLLGYEGSPAAGTDLRDDAVVGGEVHAGHASTALYEVAMRGPATATQPFVTATVRYRDGRGVPVERSRGLSDRDCAPRPADAPPRLHQDAVLAMLADRLVGGPWSEAVDGRELREQARALAGRLTGDPDVAELATIVERTVP